MKTKIRFVVAAVILAAVAALGFGHGAWAGPLMEGTVPGCSGDSCYVSADFGNLPGGFSASLVDNPDLGDFWSPVPGGGGPIITLVVLDAAGNPVEAPGLMTLCFPNPTGVSGLFRWWSTADFLRWFGVANEPGRWMAVPTYETTDGQVCTSTWITGTFSEIY